MTKIIKQHKFDPVLAKEYREVFKHDPDKLKFADCYERNVKLLCKQVAMYNYNRRVK